METGSVGLSHFIQQPVKADFCPAVSRKEPELAIMDEESMKSFFFMLAGIPYEEKAEDDGRWA